MGSSLWDITILTISNLNIIILLLGFFLCIKHVYKHFILVVYIAGLFILEFVSLYLDKFIFAEHNLFFIPLGLFFHVLFIGQIIDKYFFGIPKFTLENYVN